MRKGEGGQFALPVELSMASTIWALALLLVGVNLTSCQQAARLIKIPLTSATTKGVGTASQPVINYYTSVNIGTPPKTFNLQFDVGLSDSWVPHYEWSPFKHNLHYGNGYQCKVSSTCKKTDREYPIDYQNCKLTGKPYEDVITFTRAYGHQAAANKSQQLTFRGNFLAMSDATDGRFKEMPIDGYIGLSPQHQSGSTINNLLVELHNDHLIDNLQFSLWFSSVLDRTDGGELTLGGVDTQRYQGQIYWHHLSSATSQKWSLNLQFISIGSQLIGQQYQATLSSGHNEVLGPQVEVQKIYHILNTTRQSNLELVDCRRIHELPIITFTIDGIPYSLLPSNYIRKTTNGSLFKSETCYVAILPATSGTAREWVLGTNFLGAYYSIYDLTYRQVGFASLR